MMKKLMILTLVLGLASMANATLMDEFQAAVAAAFEFSVDGSAQPAEITINRTVDDNISLDFKLLSGHTSSGFTLGWTLNNTQANLSATSGPMTLDSSFDLGVTASVNSAQDIGLSAGNIFSPDVAGAKTLMDAMILQGTVDGDVTLEIEYTGTTNIDGTSFYPGANPATQIPIGTVVHSMVVHVVPEPMTIALLGLGGLFIRRKNRKK